MGKTLAYDGRLRLADIATFSETERSAMASMREMVVLDQKRLNDIPAYGKNHDDAHTLVLKATMCGENVKHIHYRCHHCGFETTDRGWLVSTFVEQTDRVVYWMRIQGLWRPVA